MSLRNFNLARRLALAGIFAAALVAAESVAQEEVDVAVVDAADVPESEPQDDAETIEEITVTAQKPGDRRRMDEDYEDAARAELLKNFYQMQADREESARRNAAAEQNRSRISWGYDPQEEYRMRNELDMQSLPMDRTKPATVFRLRF